MAERVVDRHLALGDALIRLVALVAVVVEHAVEVGELHALEIDLAAGAERVAAEVEEAAVDRVAAVVLGGA